MSKPLQAKFISTLEDLSLLQIVDDSLSASQVLFKLGYAAKGQYVSLLKQFLFDNEIDFSHWTSNGQPRIPLLEKKCIHCSNIFHCIARFDGKEQVTCSKGCSNSVFRSEENNPNWIDGHSTYRIRALKHYNNKCNRCGFDNPKALEIHHKDKNRENNDISNLEVVCANCHTIEHKVNVSK